MTAIEGYRLSSQQRHLWNLLTDGSAPAYTAWCAVPLPDTTDTGLLREALARVVARNEILRTVFRRVPGVDVPLQVIVDDEQAFAFDVHDLGPFTAEERQRRYEALRQEARSRSFDLESGPLLHAALIRPVGKPAQARLLLSMPALCADEASLRNLVRELDRSYAALVEGGKPDGDPLQYADFAQWQSDLLSAEEFVLEREYWVSRNPAALVGPELPFTVTAGEQGEFRPQALRLDPPADLLPGLKEAARRLGVDLPSVLLAGWHVLLQRTTAPTGLAVGVRYANRQAEELREALGVFAKYLPSTARPEPDTSFAAFARQVQAELREMGEVQEYFGWEQIEPRLAGPRDRAWYTAGFDWETAEPPGDGTLRPDEAEAVVERFQVRLSGREEAGFPLLTVWYDSATCDAGDIGVLAEQYLALLAAVVARPDTSVRSLTSVDRSAPDPAAVAPAPAVTAVHRRFEEQARLDPQRVAVRSAERTLTYARLNERANQLAHYLVKSGVGAEAPVGLCLDRSCELLVGLLGILKAGGAYVPLEPGLPLERRLAMLDGAGARVVVTVTEHAAALASPHRVVVRLDGDSARIEGESTADSQAPVATGQLAYAVFTSGSTGTPKAVGVGHGNLSAYLDGVTTVLDLPAGSDYAMLSTVAADLGNTTLFSALCTGGTLHVLPADHATDPVRLGEYLRRHPVDCLKIVPSHLRALLTGPQPEALLPARRLVLGGEAADWELIARVRELAPACRVLNHYGPTETTVGVLTHEVPAQPPRRAATVPLGHPLPHARVHVLDEAMRPAPTWVEGEIHIGGAGVARGYLGRPGLTAERFVPDPFGPPGTRLYRTGDRARRLADGTVVFLGRDDDQVKLRGFRVELGEIEAVVRRHPAVREAAVLTHEDGAGTVRPVAYAVLDAGAAAVDLRAHCAQRLPDYMVPAAFVTLERLALTPGGKLDRRALPAPDFGRDAADVPYEAPVGPAEETLAGIWAQVLGLAQVGRHDDFFALGGDSILSIQVVARAARAGLSLTPKLLFRYPTVAKLAAAAESVPAAQPSAEQGPVTGPVPATPVQRWFLEQEPAAPHHYNQSLLLRVRTPMEPAALEAAVRELVAHHDALRLTLRHTSGGEWALENAGVDAPAGPLLSVVDLREVPAHRRPQAFADLAARTQASVDLGAGCLLRAVYARLGEADDRLLLVAHHLGVDGVSWRILLEDLAVAYEQAAGGAAIRLPAKTTSFRAWAERLRDYAVSPEAAEEIPYWAGKAAVGAGRSVPQDAPGDPAANTHGASRTTSVALSAQTTRELLRSAGSAGRATAQEVLLTALGRTLAKWTGEQRVVVDVEGHGREPRWDDVDLSRTVGWFTAIYPVLLDTAGEPGAALRRVREEMAGVPGGGLGYGLLRHGRADEAATPLRSAADPAVRFNYLGQVSEGGEAGALFTSAPESAGPTADPQGRRPYLLDVTAIVTGEQLQVSWTFCPLLHKPSTVEALSAAFVDHLRAVLAREETAPSESYLPQDFPLAGIDQDELDRITSMLQQTDQG